MSSEEAKKSTRWRYYIDRRFQNLFMFRFAAIIVLILLVSLVLLFLVRANSFNGKLLPGKKNAVLYELTILETKTVDGKILEEVVPTGRSWNAFQLYWPPVVLISLVNLILVTIFGLFYSHSMAGPIHNMKESLQKMINGEEVREIKIRKSDQFQELVSLLNQFIEKRAQK